MYIVQLYEESKTSEPKLYSVFTRAQATALIDEFLSYDSDASLGRHYKLCDEAGVIEEGR